MMVALGCLLCLAAGAAPQTQPVRALAPATRPATPATRPATQPAIASVRPEIGETPIRRDAPRPQASRAEAEPQPAAPGFDFARVAGALAIVLTLIFALRWLLKRSMHGAGMPGATNAVQVLTRSPVSPRQQVLLVRVGRRLLVVSDCNGQLSPLSEITDPDEVAALVGQLRDEKLTAASTSFGNLLGRWRRGAGDGDEVEEEFPRAAPDVPERAEDDDDPAAVAASQEISGLVERVRLLSSQFKRT